VPPPPTRYYGANATRNETGPYCEQALACYCSSLFLSSCPSCNRMRNRALRGCIILSLACNFGLLENVGGIAKQAPKPKANTEQSQTKSETDKRGTLEFPLIVKPLPAEKNEQESDEDARDKSEKRWNDRATIFISIATAVILVLQLFVFGWQAISLRRTISTMKELGKEQRDIGEAQVRAYVSIKSVKIDFTCPQRAILWR
jgi:hypothetical protein